MPLLLNNGNLRCVLSIAVGLGTNSGLYDYAQPDEAQPCHYEALENWLQKTGQQPAAASAPEGSMEPAATSAPISLMNCWWRVYIGARLDSQDAQRWHENQLELAQSGCRQKRHAERLDPSCRIICQGTYTLQFGPLSGLR